MRRLGVLAGAAVAAVVLAACGNARTQAAQASGQSGGAGGGGSSGGSLPALPVEVALARRDTVVDAIPASGQIEALQSIELRPEVDGRIVEILFREGQEVQRGTALFKVDDAELKTQVVRLEAERDLAVQALERTKQLLQGGASSQSELERAEATARSTQAQLDLLKIRLDRTVVRAPFGGVVGQRFVSLGDYVNSSTRLVSLQTVHPQRAAFQVPERYARQVRPGQRVSFRVAAISGREFRGVVDFVDPVVQLPARTILVKATVPNPGRLLQPGMFIEARLAAEVRLDAVVVPEDAVLNLQGAMMVWVVQNGKATRRSVELGIRTPGFVELRSGVAAGEQVVVGGIERLLEGMPVTARVVERAPSAADR